LKSSLNAESPDEVALITAAAQHCGALLTVRNGNSMESKGIERYAYNSTYANNLFNTTASSSSSGASPTGSAAASSPKTSNAGSTPAVIMPVDGSAASFLGPTEKIELLAVNEFDSDRKMMSVLVKLVETAGPCGNDEPSKAKERLFLLCKGK
jgi:magnesium-transporting ATPase (P-type)